MEDVSFLPSFFPPLLEAFLGKVVLPSFEKEPKLGVSNRRAGGREAAAPADRWIGRERGKGRRERERERASARFTFFGETGER